MSAILQGVYTPRLTTFWQDDELRAELQLAPAASSARAARRFVDLALDAWSCADAAEVAALLTNELVTNAVLHAGGDIELRIDRGQRRIRVEVRDGSSQPLLQRSYGVDAQTGRGLALVEALAAAWGVDMVTGDGKVVWFEIDT